MTTPRCRPRASPAVRAVAVQVALEVRVDPADPALAKAGRLVLEAQVDLARPVQAVKADLVPADRAGPVGPAVLVDAEPVVPGADLDRRRKI